MCKGARQKAKKIRRKKIKIKHTPPIKNKTTSYMMISAYIILLPRASI